MQINKVSMPLQGIRRASIFAKVTAVFVFIAMGEVTFLILYEVKKIIIKIKMKKPLV